MAPSSVLLLSNEQAYFLKLLCIVLNNNIINLLLNIVPCFSAVVDENLYSSVVSTLSCKLKFSVAFNEFIGVFIFSI